MGVAGAPMPAFCMVGNLDLHNYIEQFEILR